MSVYKNFGLKIRKNFGLIPVDFNQKPKPETWVLVETDRGRECAQVIPFQKVGTKIEKNILVKKILGLAQKEDLARFEALDEEEHKFFIEAGNFVKNKNLVLKIISTELIFDRQRLILNVKITDEKKGKKINLKSLARELGQKLGLYVDMRQVGVRGEAKILSGCGVCGRNLCCQSWLGKSNPITIKMAKEQNLPLNITKISGLCGRLLCCLKYELENYRENYGKIKPVTQLLESEESNLKGEMVSDE